VTNFAVPCTVNVSVNQIAGLICTAFEGGSGYWLHDAKPTLPIDINPDGIWYSLDSYFEGDFAFEVEFDDPDSDDGSSATKIIRPADLTPALTLMASKSPRHFADIIQDNHDAITADVFMQYLVLGEIVYG
jgi:hypothetical protein